MPIQRFKPQEINKDPINRRQTVLKAENAERINQELNLKQILKVYEIQGHFHIELQSAHALGLTSVHPVITNEIPLFEISKEQLDEFMHNNSLDVVIQRADAKGNEIDTSGEQDLEDALSMLPFNKYGIGIHGIASRS